MNSSLGSIVPLAFFTLFTAAQWNLWQLHRFHIQIVMSWIVLSNVSQRLTYFVCYPDDGICLFFSILQVGALGNGKSACWGGGKAWAEVMILMSITCTVFPLLARFSYFKFIFCTTVTKILFHPKHVHISLSSKLMAIDVKTSGRLVLIHWHGYSCLNSGWYGRRCNCNSKHAHRYSPPMGIVIIINLFSFKASNQTGDVFFF